MTKKTAFSSVRTQYWSFAFSAIILCGGIAYSADIMVNPNGSGNYATIQAALDAAVSGDTVIVAAGTYNEDINIGGIGLPPTKKNNVTLKAAAGASVQVVLQNNKNRVPALAAAGADFGANDMLGFLVYGDGVVIDGIKFTQLGTEVNTLGIITTVFVISSNVVIRNCEVEGGGKDLGGDIVGIVISPMDVVTIMQGGSAVAENLTVDNCVIHDIPYGLATANLPLLLGLPYPSSDATITNCEFYNNNSGIEMDDGVTTVIDCYFHENNTGIVVSDDASTIINCVIVTSYEDGVVIEDNANEENEPAGNPIVVIDGCAIANNGENEGHDGIDIQQGTLTMKNTIIYNSAGANLHFSPETGRETNMTVDHCDFYNSFIGVGIGTPEAPEDIVNLTMTNSIITDSYGVITLADALFNGTFSYCDIFATDSQFDPYLDFITTSNVLNVDPMYVDPANGDFHLKAGSPVATAGQGGTYMGAKGLAGTGVRNWMVQ